MAEIRRQKKKERKKEKNKIRKLLHESKDIVTATPETNVYRYDKIYISGIG